MKDIDELTAEFEAGVVEILSKYFPSEQIVSIKEETFEDVTFLSHFVKCANEDDIKRAVECTSELTDFTVAFETKHGIDLDDFI